MLGKVSLDTGPYPKTVATTRVPQLVVRLVEPHAEEDEGLGPGPAEGADPESSLAVCPSSEPKSFWVAHA